MALFGQISDLVDFYMHQRYYIRSYFPNKSKEGFCIIG